MSLRFSFAVGPTIDIHQLTADDDSIDQIRSSGGVTSALNIFFANDLTLQASTTSLFYFHSGDDHYILGLGLGYRVGGSNQMETATAIPDTTTRSLMEAEDSYSALSTAAKEGPISSQLAAIQTPAVRKLETNGPMIDGPLIKPAVTDHAGLEASVIEMPAIKVPVEVLPSAIFSNFDLGINFASNSSFIEEYDQTKVTEFIRKFKDIATRDNSASIPSRQIHLPIQVQQMPLSGV